MGGNMESFKLKSVNEMFRWKLPNEDLVGDDNHIIQKSVEEYFRDSTKALSWDITDVLFSFTLMYYLGISLYDKDAFEKLYQEEKRKQPRNRLCKYSTKFLYRCSLNKRFEAFNENKDLVGFVNAYFSLGNVIPIWPGGNEARGKMGILDIPEIFFNMYPEWTKELLRQNPNAKMDSVINNSVFLVSRNTNKGLYIKGYNKAFSNIEEFNKLVKEKTDFQAENGFYFDYLLYRKNIIENRETELQNIVTENTRVLG